jgi:hypothetical protein
MRLNIGKSSIEGDIDGVLYTLEMGRNLFSVTQTMKQGKSVLFDTGSMTCNNLKEFESVERVLKTSCVVGTAHLHGGLWILDSSPKHAATTLLSRNDTLDVGLWHQRLGHLKKSEI